VRKVIISMTMTFDGFFAGPHGELDWISQTPDKELTDDLVDQIHGIEAGFIGFPTAQVMVPYWQKADQNPSASPHESAVAKAVNNLHKIVISNRQEKLDWDNAELLVAKNDKDLVQAVNAIKQRPGKDLGVPGGVRTAQAFARLGLADEYVIFVHPVVTGDGQRVFTMRTNLKLINVKSFKSGVVRIVYGA
jgi:dihydrofolate reductase